MRADEDESGPEKRLAQLYLCAVGKWRGCDWATSFGRRGLNLKGLGACQAGLLACALAGEERQAWSEAAGWLRQVEEDARDAERHADAAVFLAMFGLLDEARRHARTAHDLEASYRAPTAWGPLCEALEEAGERCPALAACG
jgi:hypothetical protein